MAARIAAAAVLLATTATGHAHDARPSYVQVTEIEENVFSVSWKVPASVPRHALPYPSFPDDCRSSREPAWRQSGGEFLGMQRFSCEQGLSGRVLGIEFPLVNPSLSTLYTVSLLNGEEYLQILKPDEKEWTVPEAENPLSVAVEYTGLGIEHIWIGVDHLLFVACLLFIARTPRRLLITITGFTVAHSVTLALSALDLVRIPTPPVEAAIALSVVFMAWEILKRDEKSLAYRYPVAVSSSFGLLHGFGFAAVLRDIGLPQTELPVALLFFNVGVEIGQILFVLALVAGYLLLKPRQSLAVPASYVIGIVASYWLIDRVTGFWA